MGGGGSSSSQEETTQVTTETTTEIGEIGLTGSDAVALAAVLEQGGLEREAIAAEGLQRIAQEQGQSFRNLVGGAGLLTVTSGAVSEELAREGGATGRYLAGVGGETADAQLRAGAGTGRFLAAQGRGIAGDVLEAGSEAGESLAARGHAFGSEVAGRGQAFASDVLETGASAIEGLTSAAERQVAEARGTGRAILETSRAQARTAQGEESDLVKIAPFLSIAILSTMLLLRSD